MGFLSYCFLFSLIAGLIRLAHFFLSVYLSPYVLLSFVFLFLSPYTTTILAMAINDDKRRPAALQLQTARKSSSDSTSSTSSLGKGPRTPRFAEATSIHSPVEAQGDRNVVAQSQPGDIGFGYIIDNRESAAVPMSPRSPLKSAMKVPGTPGRVMNPMSPTFREEQVLEKREAATDVEQAKDLVCLTGVNARDIY